MRKRHVTGPSHRTQPSSVPAAGLPDQPAGADREAMVREAAYLLHESRGCRPGHALDDWVEAESLIAARFPQGEERADAAGIEQISETPSDVVSV